MLFFHSEDSQALEYAAQRGCTEFYHPRRVSRPDRIKCYTAWSDLRADPAFKAVRIETSWCPSSLN